MCFCIIDIFTPIHTKKEKSKWFVSYIDYNIGAQTPFVSSYRKTTWHTLNAPEQAGNVVILVSFNPDSLSGWILVQEVVSSTDHWIISNKISVTFNHFLACPKMPWGNTSNFLCILDDFFLV